MCEQCIVKAVVIKENALPGFFLMQAMEGSEHWPKGWYGLVQMNDSLVVFPSIEPDPLVGISDEEISTRNISDVDFTTAVDNFIEYSAMPPLQGFVLTKACMEAGYKINEDGYLESWLINHLSQYVK